MTTRDDVLDAINRIERAGHAGELTRAAQLELLMLPPQDYDRILNRLRNAFPELVPPAPAPRPVPSPPPEAVPQQQGIAVQAMKKAEAALSHQQSATAQFDRQVIEALLHAHETTAESRGLLDDLETQLETAANTWDLSTAAGAREFQKFLIGKLRQIVTVVQDTNDDDTAKQALAAAWAALYAGYAPRAPHDDEPESTAPGQGRPAGENNTPQPEPAASKMDSYPLLPEDDPGPPAHAATPSGPAARPAPEFGGGMPGAGMSPFGGMPMGFPPAGFMPGLQRPPAGDEIDGGAPQPDELLSAPTPAPDELADRGAGEDSPPAADAPLDADPTTVKLPDGDTVSAPTLQLAAVLRAASGGVPISDAFRQQGIEIPPPGTAVPVTGQVDPARLRPGDIGMFTDRHALAVGNSKALLDGQIHRIDNVGGPSFLGWQHPPTLTEQTPTQTPTPTRLSAKVRA